MKKLSIIFLLAGAVWSCNSAKTAERQASTNQLPAMDSPMRVKGNFEKEFLAKFPVAELPMKINTQIVLGDTIPAQNVIQYILESASEAKVNAFADFWGENENMTRKGLEDRFLNQDKNVFMVLNFGYGSRLHLHPDYYTVCFQVIPTFMEGSYAYTYLVNFDKVGKMLDAVRLSANEGYVDMQMFKTAEITADGLIKIESKNIKRGGMQDGTADITEFAYLQYKATEKGVLSLLSERYTGYSGNFEGKESSEIFKIEQYPAHLQISYLPTPDGSEQIDLEMVQFNKETRTIIAKHPEKDVQFVLTYDQDMKKIVCKSSEGKTISFARKS
jgi:hypothetical protein